MDTHVGADMKVYLVSLLAIEDYPPVAIFRSKKRAIACADKVGKETGEGAEVIEFDLNMPVADAWAHRFDAHIHQSD